MNPNADNMGVDSGFDALDYRYTNPKNGGGDPAIYGERDLWCAVIAQAFMDMGAITPPNSGRRPEQPASARGKDYDEAVRWLLRDKKDFAYICDLAGVSAHIIRHAALMFHRRTQSMLGAVYNTKT